MRSSAALVVIFACCLLATTGCGQPPEGQNPEKAPRRAGVPNEDHLSELPRPEMARYGSPSWPPPVWLVSGDRAVQASYGEFCELDVCGGEVILRQSGGDPATAELPVGEPAIVVVGRGVPDDLSVAARWRRTPARLAHGR